MRENDDRRVDHAALEVLQIRAVVTFQASELPRGVTRSMVCVPRISSAALASRVALPAVRAR